MTDVENALADSILKSIDNHDCKGEHCKICLELMNGDLSEMERVFCEFEYGDEEC